MAIERKPIDLSSIPYQHKSAAAGLLISKAKRVIDFPELYFGELGDKEIRKARQAVSLYDMALHLMKPYDGNYQTIIHWKCLTLIALEQYQDATSWYEELIRLAIDSEGVNFRNATAKEAERQLKKIAGKKNTPLPPINDKDGELLDDPSFCWWANQFCEALVNKKYALAYGCLSDALAKAIPQKQLKQNWLDLLDGNNADIDVLLERYELPQEGDAGDYVGWCYFVITGDEVNEAISVDIYQRPDQGYEIRDIEFGRP